jgi:hypothetical protein
MSGSDGGRRSAMEGVVAQSIAIPANLSRRSRRAALGVALAMAALELEPAIADDSDASFLLSFAAGDYAVVGREPDGGAAYAGTAQITQDGNQLILERRIGGRTVRALGRVEVPSPPGEGQVLRFRWGDGQAMLMTCLVAGDLDNYARLTCLWGADEQAPKEPGLEAMFSTAAWGTGSQN